MAGLILIPFPQVKIQAINNPIPVAVRWGILSYFGRMGLPGIIILGIVYTTTVVITGKESEMALHILQLTCTHC